MKYLTITFSVMGVCLFAGLMFHALDKYNDHICEMRYGAGDNQTLKVILEHPLIQYAGQQTCKVAQGLTEVELLMGSSLLEQIWNKITPSEPHKYRMLAHAMLGKCGENVLRGPCCEKCVKYRLVTGQ